MVEMVKCSECGYLTVRNMNTYCLDEAGSDFREKGMVALGREYGRNQYPLHEAIPLCFARCQYLGEKVKNITQKNNPTEEVSRIIKEETKCTGFVKWQQGFTPKEHGEMIDRQWMMKYQERREREDKEWREQQEDKQRNWMQSQSKQRFRWEIIVFGILVTLALIGGQILAAFIERGDLFP